MKFRILLLALPLMWIATPAVSQLVDPVVDDNEFSARIELSGVSADLTVRFEEVVGLSLDNLGITVQLVNPLDLNILSRLPGGSLVSVPSGFPVLVRIDPPVDGGLAFEGVVEVELYTQNLHYTIGSPFRLFTAPTASGTFHDITEHVSGGSYRTRSGGAHFSDFMILADTRTTADVVDDKFDRLDDVLTTYQGDIDAVLYSQLSGLADDALVAWMANDPATAIRRIDDFRQVARTASEAGQLPKVWRSARDLSNIDGELRATARTLRFSLTLAANLL